MQPNVRVAFASIYIAGGHELIYSDKLYINAMIKFQGNYGARHLYMLQKLKSSLLAIFLNIYLVISFISFRGRTNL